MYPCSDGIAKPANKGKLPKTERGQEEEGVEGWKLCEVVGGRAGREVKIDK